MLNPDIDLSGQCAIVTGASRGIGAATARRLAKAGAKVTLLARSSNDIKALADEIGDNALAICCDVSSWPAIKQAVEKTLKRFGSLNILVNNAGVIDPVARIENADPAAWSQVVDINLQGPFYAVRAVLPAMAENGGVIVNVSSGAATNALEGWSHYCTTKAALFSLTQCVHKECADQGVRCVGISPGTVATDMQTVIKESGVNPVSQLDWSQHISPQIVGDAITWLCTDAARTYDGTDFSLKTAEGRAALGWVKV
ncbi:SDR family oxidoreductase [uncultured Tateyamaria sp.]|uniref:SDR family oxidoreductase n=1 Tax=uncultured Tateyamaria sp. TaxID=455651 RepID=UPI00262CC41F|nr:SDR family oxidoreductase [uncultured Tateyamaria sp.]